MSERISISLDNESIEKLDNKCKEFEFTRQEYIKFILNSPEKVTVHKILMTARKTYNVGDTFTIQSLIKDDLLSSSEKANLVKRTYSWISKFSNEFVITSEKKILRVF